jgi:spore maturation protein CgeB
VTFSNEDEFEYKIKYYLNNEEERKAIAENGYKTVQKFSRDNWAVRLLEGIYK